MGPADGIKSCAPTHAGSDAGQARLLKDAKINTD